MDKYIQAIFEEGKKLGIQKGYLLQLQRVLNQSSIDWSELERIELSIYCSIENNGSGYNLETGENKYFKYIKKEIYKVLSDESEKYKKEKDILNGSIPVIVGHICSVMGVAEPIWGGIITVMLMIPFRVGIEAWCAYYKENGLEDEE